MKKLISAASALAMAASMVGAAVPFATGAADSTKGFELRAFTNKAGETVSTKISTDEINAGDVTIPIGVYVTENTPDSKALVAQWTIDSADGDASNSNISFSSVTPGSKYFDSEQTVTLADGSTVSTDLFVGFCGTLSSGKKGMTFSDTSKDGMYSVQENQLSWGCENPWGSAVWVKPTTITNYEYTGSASDSFPVFVFEATFKKGTPAGTYTIDFLDKQDEQGVPATYIEAGVGTTVKHTIPNKNLTLKGIEITIGDGAAPAQSTTAQQTPATTAATTAQQTPATTATPVSSGTPADDDYYSPNGYTKINPNFIVSAQDYVVVPGEDKEVVFEVNSGDSYASAFTAELLDLPAGITATLDDPTCYADPDMHEWEFYNGFSYQIKVVSKDGSNPIRLLDSVMESEYDNDILQLTLHIPDDIAPGEYTYGFKAFDVTEYAQTTDEHEQSEFMATRVHGKLIVEGEAPGTTAATTGATTAATTKATTVATTAASTGATTANTTKAPVTGDVLYGDSNCDGKVNIADVVVLNRHLADAKYTLSDQGIVNADCCDEKGGAGLDKNDSDAIIKYIVSLVKELPCTSADLK